MSATEHNYKASRAPFLRSSDTTKSIMMDMIVALCFPIAFACYLYGVSVLWRVLFAGACCYIADFVANAMSRRKSVSAGTSSFVTGAILALLLPANVSYYILLSGSLFAILVAKEVFGGIGNNIFNPAAVGLAFVTVIYSDTIFWYPQPFVVEETLTRSLTYTLKFGGIPSVSFMDMLVGNYCGPMGATNTIIITCCFVFLALRRTVSSRIPITFVATVGIIALLFPRVSCTPLESVVYELGSGYILFAAVFMLTDPVTAPKHSLSKHLYGIIAGVLAMIFRHLGGYEQGVCFAILLTNAMSHSLDRFTLYLKTRRLTV